MWAASSCVLRIEQPLKRVVLRQLIELNSSSYSRPSHLTLNILKGNADSK